MKTKTALILGDFLAIAIITLIGFATHGESNLSFLPRMAAIFFPLSLSWFLIAPWFGIFQDEIICSLPQLWRPALAMIFAVPLAVILRGLILSAPILPIFAVVLSATSALGMMLWRMVYFALNRK